jgi:hypothetical protein
MIKGKHILYWISLIIGILAIFIISKYYVKEDFSTSIDVALGANPAVSAIVNQVNSLVNNPAVADASGAVNSASGAVNSASGAVSGAVNSASGAVSGAVNGASGAVAGAVADVSGAIAGAVKTTQSSGIKEMPYLENLVMFVNAFNVDSKQNTTFDISKNSWIDGRDGNTTKFTFINTPLKMTNRGLPIKNVTLIGPESNKFADPSTYDTLESFSILFYGKFNSIVFTNATTPIMLYQAFAETPNKVILSLHPKDQNNISLHLILGNAGSTYSWDIPVTTIMSNGNTTLYSLVFDNTNKTKPTATFYIGSIANNANLDPVNDEIKLGLSPIQINLNQNWDMRLIAFAHYNIILTRNDLAQIGQYFEQQAGGYAALQDELTAAQAIITKLQSTIDGSVDELAQCNSKLADCSQSLETCNINLVSTEQKIPKEKHWQIKQKGNANISTDELHQCSILDIKRGLNKHSDSKTPSPSSTNNKESNITGNNSEIGTIYDPIKDPKTASDAAQAVRNKMKSTNTNTPSPSPTIPAIPGVTPDVAGNQLLSLLGGFLSSSMNANQSTPPPTTPASYPPNQAPSTVPNTGFQTVYNTLVQDATNPTANLNNTTNPSPASSIPAPAPSAATPASASFWNSIGF